MFILFSGMNAYYEGGHLQLGSNMLNGFYNLETMKHLNHIYLRVVDNLVVNEF